MNWTEHFKQGYYLTSVGGFFNCFDIILEIERSELQEIKSAVNEGVTFLAPLKAKVKDRVIFVMETAIAENLKPSQPPKLPADYYPWAGFLNQRKNNAYDPLSEPMLAYSTGYYLGDILSFLEYISFCSFLWQLTNNPFFEKQVEANRKKMQESIKMAQVFILSNIKNIQNPNSQVFTEIFDRLQQWEKDAPSIESAPEVQLGIWTDMISAYSTLFDKLSYDQA